MTGSNGKTQDITLGDEFDAFVRYGRTTVEMHPGGDLIVKTNGNAVVYTNGDVKVRPAANDSGEATFEEPKPGNKMDDGTIYAGISPDTGRPMFAQAHDAFYASFQAEPTVTLNYQAAQRFVMGLNKGNDCGHNDWRMPTKNELNVLFNNRAAIGGFSESGLPPAGRYWASGVNPYCDFAWNQRFSDGDQIFYYRGNDSSLRCVRG